VEALGLDTTLLSFLGIDTVDGVSVRHWAVAPIDANGEAGAIRAHYWDTNNLLHHPYKMTTSDRSSEIEFIDFQDDLSDAAVHNWHTLNFDTEDITSTGCAVATASALVVPFVSSGLEELPEIVDFYAGQMTSVLPNENLPSSYTAYWGALHYEQRRNGCKAPPTASTRPFEPVAVPNSTITTEDVRAMLHEAGFDVNGTTPDYDDVHQFWEAQAAMSGVVVDVYLESLSLSSGLTVDQLHTLDASAAGRRLQADASFGSNLLIHEPRLITWNACAGMDFFFGWFHRARLIIVHKK
jgi:hypothetical protein